MATNILFAKNILFCANKKTHANIHFFFSSQGKGPEFCDTPWILINQTSVSVFQSRFLEIHMSFVASEIKAFYPNFWVEFLNHTIQDLSGID